MTNKEKINLTNQPINNIKLEDIFNKNNISSTLNNSIEKIKEKINPQIEEIDLDLDENSEDNLPIKYNNTVIYENSKKEITVKVTDKDGKIHKYNPNNQGNGLGLSDNSQTDYKMLNIFDRASALKHISDYTNLTVEEITDDKNDKGISLLDAFNAYTINSGCGGYSTLAALNGYYGKDIKPIDFFIRTFIKSFGEEEWKKIMYQKKASLLGEENTGTGPINTLGADMILKSYGYNNNKILSNYSQDDFKKGGKYCEMLKKHLYAGKPAIIMLKAKKQDYNKELVENSFVGSNQAYAKDFLINCPGLNSKKPDNTWTNTLHFVLLTSMDTETDIVTVIDSRFLPNQNNGKEEFNHVRKMKYDDLVEYIKGSGEEPNTLPVWCDKDDELGEHSTNPGCLLIDY